MSRSGYSDDCCGADLNLCAACDTRGAAVRENEELLCDSCWARAEETREWRRSFVVKDLLRAEGALADALWHLEHWDREDGNGYGIAVTAISRRLGLMRERVENRESCGIVRLASQDLGERGVR
jgi:hypothetical protein